MTDLPIKIIFIYLINYINFKIIIHVSYFRNNWKKKIFQNNYEKKLLRNWLNYWETLQIINQI